MSEDLKTNCYISESLELDGNLKIAGNVQFNGRLNGYFECSGTVYASNQSDINADIIAKNLNVNGSIKGNVSVEEIAYFQSQSHFHGSLTTCHLTIEQGATFNCQCKILSPPKNKKPNSLELRKARKAIEHRE